MNDDKKEITKKSSSGKTTSGNSRKKQKDGGIADKETKVDDAKKRNTDKVSTGKVQDKGTSTTKRVNKKVEIRSVGEVKVDDGKKINTRNNAVTESNEDAGRKKSSTRTKIAGNSSDDRKNEGGKIDETCKTNKGTDIKATSSKRNEKSKVTKSEEHKKVYGESEVNDSKKERIGKSSNGKTTKVLESSSANDANENMDSNESESNPNESSDRLCKIRTYTPKSKPATKTLTGQVQKFFKENEPVRRLCTYTLGKNINCRVLENRGSESFMNIDNKYYMFNHEDQSLKDFGDIFEIGIDSMMDVPWLDSD